jgi:crotonobetainyl-CoA:carnitine CoA-transferase CaiB-like acyl-CoA transferase
MSATSSYPLAGIRVLDLSRILAGPVCTQLLADLGADVVKIERPGSGDDTRHWGPPFAPDGTSGYFLSCNRGKRSVALELQCEPGQRVLAELVRRADVLVENFLPDSLARLGLQPERLLALNPRLVIASISGFGRTGPWAGLPGYDLMIQAACGLMAITGEPDGRPMKTGVAITDVITGLYAAAAVLAGLVARGKASAQGGWAFDLALADCTLASLVNVAQDVLLTNRPPRRYGNAHPHIVPYESFATADGHIVLAIGSDRQWQRFCQAVGKQQWAEDARFATNPQRVQNRAVLIPLLQALLAGRTTAEWRDLLAQAEIPHSPVLNVDAALATPQAQARGMVWPADGPDEVPLLGSALHWHGQPSSRGRRPPLLGQHTAEVLKEWLEYSDEQVADLASQRIVEIRAGGT